MPRRYEEPTRRTFGMDHSLSRGILKLISDIAKNSTIPFSEQKKRSRPFYEALKAATEKSNNEITEIRQDAQQEGVSSGLANSERTP